MHKILDNLCFWKNGVVVVEEAACRRNVTYDNGFRRQTYYLSLPKIIFRINYNIVDGEYKYNSSYSFVVDDNSSHVYLSPLYNIGRYGKVCLGERSFFHKDLNEFVFIYLNKYWKNSFNDDLIGSNSFYFGKDCGKFFTWEKKTKEDKKWVPSDNDLVIYDDFRWFKFLRKGFKKAICSAHGLNFPINQPRY